RCRVAPRLLPRLRRDGLLPRPGRTGARRRPRRSVRGSDVPAADRVGVGRAEAFVGTAAGLGHAAREPLGMAIAAVSLRPAEEDDRRALAELSAAVAEERDGIAAEPPVDVDARAARFALDTMVVAVADSEIVGYLHVDQSWFGVGELGMLVAADWRGR